MPAKKAIPAEALITLRQRLRTLPPRSRERREAIQESAAIFGVTEVTLYRVLREHSRPRSLKRIDCGVPRVMPVTELERYCEVIAAIKVRTANRKGRHLSTAGAIRLLEDYGLFIGDEPIRAPPGALKRSTVNRYLKQWGFDRHTLLRERPAVRFQATHSNQCWQFDVSPSDLKHVNQPPWIDGQRGPPTLLLFSVVDDRSGVAYQEYRCGYGEGVEAALRFLFNAMSPKPLEAFPFQGIPERLYCDCGPIYHSLVFQQVMGYLGVELKAHMPKGSDRRRTTARAKGKVERPFRTVKEMHETLYHFHEPQTEEEANAWLHNFLLRYNHMSHRSEPHSRLEDWLINLPASGIRAMCNWDRFCTFAREPERRKVGSDARVSVDGVVYEIDPDLAGETVVVWLGVFDDELYAEASDQRYGPYRPVAGPVPLHRYRRFKKTKFEQRAERIEALANQLQLPKAALADTPQPLTPLATGPIPARPFMDPDPFQELTFASTIDAKSAIADYLCMPLGRLPEEQLQFINDVVAGTLDKQEVMTRIRDYFQAMWEK